MEAGRLGLPFSAALWERERAAVLTLTGDVDFMAIDAFEDALAELLDTPTEAKVVDLTLASFIDSTALARLVGSHRLAGSTSRFVVVCPPALLRILRMAGIDQLMELRSSLGDALDAVY